MAETYKLDAKELKQAEPNEVIQFLSRLESVDAQSFLELFSYYSYLSELKIASIGQLCQIAYYLYNVQVFVNEPDTMLELMAKCSGRKILLYSFLEETPSLEQKANNVLTYYTLCNKLKDIVRTGWKDWKVTRERVESVAEHIFGVQMLAIAMKSEFHYNVDLSKVIMMLAVHELEEIYIGDLTQFQISKEEKIRLGHEAIDKVLSPLLDKITIKDLILEFDERETPEAKFAYHCDKLECDLQSKLYDEEGCVDLNNQEGNSTFNDKEVQELLNSGKNWSDMWMTFGKRRYNYDENFTAVSDYAKAHDVHKLVK